MITCNLMGGLGNQLFQIFVTIAYSLKTKNQFKFLSLKTLGGGSSTIRNTYWDNIFYNLKPFLIDNLPDVTIIKEDGFAFNELPINKIKNNDVMLFGYFQSYKYFQDSYDILCRFISLNKLKEVLIYKLKLNDNYFDNIISMHFRIGDYKKIQEIHPLLKYDYYYNALIHVLMFSDNTQKKVLYFCEDDDIDDVMKIINKLQLNLKKIEFIRENNNLSDWEQLLLMSCCHHNIIANSSYSWWAAYFNSYKNKIVCYPSIWFGQIVVDTKDLCPPEWVKIVTN